MRDKVNKRHIEILLGMDVPFRGGICLDFYNRQWHDDAFVTVTARYDDGNKFVTSVCETE